MDGSRQKAIIVLLAINAVLICFFGISLKKQLDKKNEILSSHISNIYNSIYSLENSISSRIKNELEQRYNLVESAEYKFTNIDPDANRAVLDITVKLRAVNAYSSIFLSLSETGKDNVQEVELVKRDGLVYSADVELDLQKNYQYDIIERVNGGGQALLNTYRHYINLYDEFYIKRVQVHSTGSGRSKDQLDFNFSFSVNDFGLDEFGLENVILEILHKDETIDTIDITGRLEKYAGNQELQERYNLAVASGEIEPDMSLEEYKEYFGFAPEEGEAPRKQYNYTHIIKYDTDYPELQLDQEKAGNIRFGLIITCRDGYRYVWK